MPYDSKAVLETRLTEVRTQITNCRKVQASGMGEQNITMARLETLLKEEQWLLGQIQAGEAQDSGGMFNKVRFRRPT